MKRKIGMICGVIFLATTSVLTGCSNVLAEEDYIQTEMESENTVDSMENDEIEIKEIYIDIDTESWEAILAEPMEEEYYSATVTIGEETVANVGFRTKGNSSLQFVANSDSERYGFRVNIDKYVDGQTIGGTNEFVLNTSFSDPSYMREYITYMAMAEIGGITPDVSYANLYINDEYYGLYLYIEAYDDTFIENVTEDEEACLYKADGENCTLDSATGTSGFEEQHGDDEDMENIDHLIAAIEEADNGNYEDLEEILDVDSVLRAMAVNYLCGNYDSYSGDKAHNYYLLYADGEFTYLGWDYNMAFGTYSPDGGASLNVEAEEPIYNTTLEERPLYKVLLEKEQYVEQYYAYLEELAEYLSNWEEIIQEIEVEIENYVEIDPTAFYTYEEFKENLLTSGMDLTEIQGMNNKEMMQASRGIPQGVDIPEDADAPEIGRGMPGEGAIPENGELPEDGRIIPEQGAIPENGELPEGGRMDSVEGAMGENGELPGAKIDDSFGMMQDEVGKSVISIADYIVTILEKYTTSN